MLNHNDEIANTMIIVPLDKSPGGVVFFFFFTFWGQRTRQEKHDGKYQCETSNFTGQHRMYTSGL